MFEKFIEIVKLNAIIKAFRAAKEKKKTFKNKYCIRIMQTYQLN